MGIGHPGDRGKVLSYVLKDFGKEDRAIMSKLSDAVAEALPLFIQHDQNQFMNKVVVLTAPPQPKRRANAPDPEPREGTY